MLIFPARGLSGAMGIVMASKGNKRNRRIRKIESCARGILLGNKITDYRLHHRAMDLILTDQYGYKKPEGMTLSKTCPRDCPGTYEAKWYGSKGRFGTSLVCNDPEHYVWESMAENNARNSLSPHCVTCACQ